MHTRYLACFIGMMIVNNLSAQQFTDVTEEAGINHAFTVFQGTFGGGVAVLDYNNDGWEDLFLAGGLGPDALYHNNGDGSFFEITAEAGLAINDPLISQGAITADVNRDGFVDIFMTTVASFNEGREIPRASDVLYLNNGDGTFKDVSEEYGINQLKTFSTGAAFGDFNADGYPDLFVGNYFDKFDGDLGKINGGTITGEQRPSADELYINVRGVYFRNVTDIYQLYETGFSFGAVFTDYDNDSDLDLYVINDFGNRATPNQLYRNEFPRTAFTNVSEEMQADFGINAMGTGIGDYNNDGLLDYFISNFRVSPFMVNQASGQPFENMTNQLGTAYGLVTTESGQAVVPISWGVNFFDFDHDTDVDLFICNGALNPSVIPNPNIFLENQGDKFKDIGQSVGLADPGIGRGSVTFDYDNDGDLDLFVVNQKPVNNAELVRTTKSKLYRNDSPQQNWLKVKLKGVNADLLGLGSRIEVFTGNLKQIREIDGGSSHESQNSTIAHFGVGDALIVDSVVVKWVGGKTQEVKNVSANQQITIRETDEPIFNFEKNSLKVYPSLFTDNVIIEYELEKEEPIDISVYDVTGRLVKNLTQQNTPAQTGFWHWNIERHLSQGVYIFQLRTKDIVVAERAIKM